MLGFQPKKHQKTFGVLTPIGTEGELERFPREPRTEGRFAPGKGKKKGTEGWEPWEGRERRGEESEGRWKGRESEEEWIAPPTKRTPWIHHRFVLLSNQIVPCVTCVCGCRHRFTFFYVSVVFSVLNFSKFFWSSTVSSFPPFLRSFSSAFKYNRNKCCLHLHLTFLDVFFCFWRFKKSTF